MAAAESHRRLRWNLLGERVRFCQPWRVFQEGTANNCLDFTYCPDIRAGLYHHWRTKVLTDNSTGGRIYRKYHWRPTDTPPNPSCLLSPASPVSLPTHSALCPRPL